MKYTLTVFTILIVGISVACAEPTPGIGLLIKAKGMPALRKKIQAEPWKGMFSRIQNEADKALVDWPKKRVEIAPYLDELLDLTVEFDAVTKDPVARKAGEAMGKFAQRQMCPTAFVYLMSGEKRYADVAFDILLHMGKVNRWGWFNWSGSAMPQIHAGMFFRNAAFTLDFIWEALTDKQRKQARDIIAEKAVEPYYRLTLHSPAMGLHHLRSKNQGNNVLSCAMIACLALGENYPDAKMWLHS